ncbi:MAG: hypothetical protein VZR95_06310 [Alphaproteobacteria bacterium]
MRIVEFVKDVINRIDKNVNAMTLIELLLVSSMYSIMKFSNPQWFVENGIVENLQLVILSVAFLICLTAKSEKKFFVFCSFIVLFLMIRETNLGRAFFCEKFLAPDEICRWKNMKYGYLADVIRILLAIGIGVYAVYHKLWQPLWKYVSKAPVYIWDIGVMFFCAAVGIAAEFECIDSEILEECAETVMYMALAYCLWRYSRYKFEV